MAEFTRNPETENIFEGTSEQVIEVTLRIKDDFSEHFNNNEANELKFEQVLRQISNKEMICYFQKQKEFERKDRITGNITKQSTHKIIIPIQGEKAIEGTLSLFNDEYSYRVVKLKQVSFYNAPVKNTLKRNCKLSFRLFNDYKGFVASEKFKELYVTIEELQLPLVDINKEKDKQVWQNYVVALKKLIKQKEQVWKIRRIESPKYEVIGDEERAAYINIFIDETELTKQLQADILDLFNENELEDYNVNDEKAIIEFKNYRELNQHELSQLKELGEELFYQLSVNSPTHYISGEIAFKYSDNISKEEIFTDIKSKLQTEYQLECSITNDGYIDLKENDIPHLQKIIEDNFSHLLTIYKDNLVQLKVEFSNEKELFELSTKLKSQIIDNGYQNVSVTISKDAKNIIVEIPVPIFQDRNGISIFKGAGIPAAKLTLNNLEIEKSIIKFSSNQTIRAREIQGFEFDGKNFQITNPSREQIASSIATLENEFRGVRFKKIPSLYYFKTTNNVNPDTLRNFKTKTDQPRKTEFVLANSTLRVSAESIEDYEVQLKRVKELFPTATIETKPFNPTYQIQFKTDLDTKRQSVLARIKNEIIGGALSKVDFDSIKNFTKLYFEYRFKSDDEREKFKQAVITACSEHHHILNFSFENHLGRTIYELRKNKNLHFEKEKETANNVRNASFVFITKEQKKLLEDDVEFLTDDYDLLKEQRRLKHETNRNIVLSQQIGKLSKKEGNKLKFKLSDEFDILLTGKENERLELEEIKEGFIKPIFPGELANIGRMIRAMKKITDPESKTGFPANRNLSNFLFDPNEARQSSADLEEEKVRILADLNEPLLRDNSKQLEAVAKALVAIDMALIQGPPGTGKTTVIAEIIWQELLREPQSRILITSQTHLAVDNALERLSGKKLIRPIRIGDIDKFEEEGKKYADIRIKTWLQSNFQSEEEKINSGNAICEWIENVKVKCSEEEKYSKAVNKWQTGLTEKGLLIKKTFSDAYYKYVNVFAATCSECGSPRFSKAFKETFASEAISKIEPEFDVVIMDEASKATPPELVLPLTLGKKVVIIGDHKQLPPMIDEDEFTEALEAVGAKELVASWSKSDYKTSQFEKLFKAAPQSFVASLETQFRMHKQIMDCINQFYIDELPNGLICGIKGEMDIPDYSVKASRWHGIEIKPFINQDNHAIWLNIDSPEIQEGGHYYSNDGEVDAIYKVIKLLTSDSSFKVYHDFMKTQREENQEIGIITFYGPQKKKLGNKFYPYLKPNDWKEFDKHKYENEFGIPFRINTVDKFQGMEKNILVISTVRSNRQIQIDVNGNRSDRPNTDYPKSLGFAQEHPRINVGLSRAKRLLIVIGNEKHFMQKPEYEQAILKMHRIDFKQIQNLISK